MSFPRYESYKDSGVEWLGEVPEHWVCKPFWTLYRRTKRTGYVNEQLLSVYRDYGVIPKASRDDNNNKPSDDLNPYQLVKVGDLAINKMKAWQGSVAISEYQGIVSPAYFVYESTNDEISRFLHYLMRSSRYITGYLTLSKGIRVNQWDLEPQYHSRMSVVLPPKDEQQIIATFLDRETAKIDALIAEQQRLIELLKEKRQSVISHAVTKGLNPKALMKDSGIEWLGEVPNHWEVRPIKFVICKIDSGTSVNAIDEPAQNHEIGVLKTSCVYSGIFNSAENKTVIEQEIDRVSCPLKTDTLIVSRMNTPDLVGATGLVTDAPVNIYLPDRLWQVSFSDTCTAFIYFWTQTPVYRAYIKSVCAGTSSSMQNLSQDQFRSFVLALPTFDEQFRIAEFLQNETTKLDTLTTEAKTAIILLQERRTALISAAVTGKIDVRGIAA